MRKFDSQFDPNEIISIQENIMNTKWGNLRSTKTQFKVGENQIEKNILENVPKKGIAKVTICKMKSGIFVLNDGKGNLLYSDNLKEIL